MLSRGVRRFESIGSRLARAGSSSTSVGSAAGNWVPELTVVIPTYNRAELVVRAVRSALDQTFADIEVVVVDDGSTDDTVERLARIDDRRLRVVRQGRGGRTAARNRGAATAASPFLVFLDSDDEVLPGWAAALHADLAKGGVGIASCGAEMLVDKAWRGESKQEIRRPRDYGFRPGVNALFLTGAFAMRTDLFREIGGYDERMAFAENTELSHRLVARCLERKLVCVSRAEPLVVFHNTRPSPTPAALRERIRGVRIVLHRHGRLYRSVSPVAYARLCSVAGVCHVRLGEVKRARRWFALAMGSGPRKLAHGMRWAATLVPGLARALWPAQERGSLRRSLLMG